MATPHHAQVALKVEAFGFLFEIVNHTITFPVVGRTDRKSKQIRDSCSGVEARTATVLYVLVKARVSQLHVQMLAELLLHRRRSRPGVSVVGAGDCGG